MKLRTIAISLIKNLNKEFKKFDPDKVADFNKVVKFLAKKMPTLAKRAPIAIGHIAEEYRLYRAQRPYPFVDVDTIESVMKRLKKLGMGKMKEMLNYPNYLKNVGNVPGIQKDGEHRYYNPKTSKKKKVSERVWTPAQEKAVNKLDSEFNKLRNKKGIEPYSYEASQLWTSAGFRKKMRKIFGKDESISELKDHEGSMAKSQLERSMKYAKMIYKVIDNVGKGGEVAFPAWVQSKLTKAEDYLQSVYNYLDGKDGLDDKFQENLGESLPNKVSDKFKKMKPAPSSEKKRLKQFYKHHKSHSGPHITGQGAEPDTYDWDDQDGKEGGVQTKEKDKKKRGYEPV